MTADIVGIDLGTTNTVFAVRDAEGPRVIKHQDGATVLPSCVAFLPHNKEIVGSRAKQRRIIDPENTILGVKRILGRTYNSPEVQDFSNRVRFEIRESEAGNPIISTRSGVFRPAEISARVLSEVRSICYSTLGSRPSKAVITVPANFSDSQRAETASAAGIAGLEVLQILNEPTAAALAYGYRRSLEEIVAVYDFGGGTFDISILHIQGKTYRVLGTAGNTYLGGEDIDNAIADFLARELLIQSKIDVTQDYVAKERLLDAAETAKIALSSQEATTIKLEEIGYLTGGKAYDFEYQLSRNQINEIILPIVEKTKVVCEEALTLAQLDSQSVKSILMVGGTSRIPLVRKQVQSYFNSNIRTDINPEQAVATGAAIMARAKVHRSPTPPPPPRKRTPKFSMMPLNTPGISRETAADDEKTLIRHQDSIVTPVRNRPTTVPPIVEEVTPHPIGIGTVAGFCETIITRNSRLPASQSRAFATSKDGQTTVKIKVFQGDSNKLAENTLLGTLTLSDLNPSTSRNDSKILVTFTVDENGILSVKALDTVNKQEKTAILKVRGTQTKEQFSSSWNRLRQP